MTILLRYGLVVSLFWKPIRDVLQRWRICLASLVFFTIFLTNNFGLSTGTYHQRTTSIGPSSTGLTPTGSDPDHNSKINTRNHEYQLSNYLSSKHSRTSSSVNEGSVSDSYLSHHDRQYLGDMENGIRHAPAVERRSHHAREQNVPHTSSSSHPSSSSNTQHYQRSSDISSSSPASLSPASGSSVHSVMDVNVRGGISSLRSSSEHNPTSSMFSDESSSASDAQTGSNIKTPQSSSVLQHQSSASVSRDPSVSSSVRFSTVANGVSSTKHTQSDNKKQFTEGWGATEPVKNDVKLKNVTTLSATQDKSNQANTTVRFYHDFGVSEMTGKIAPSSSTSNPQPRRRNVESHVKIPTNLATVSSTQCQSYTQLMLHNASRSRDSTHRNTKPEQCLADQALDVCSRPADWDADCQRTQHLRTLYLGFCSPFQLYHTIPHETKRGRTCRLERLSQEACLGELREVLERDRQARDIFNNFKTIFSKFDCQDLRAADMWTCQNCTDAYRDWVCSMTVPYYRGDELVQPCGSYCEQVENKCPYFKPHFLDTYAGEPTFFCTDKYTRNEDIPQTERCHHIQELSGVVTVKEPEWIPDAMATGPASTVPPQQLTDSSTQDLPTNGTAPNVAAVLHANGLSVFIISTIGLVLGYLVKVSLIQS